MENVVMPKRAVRAIIPALCLSCLLQAPVCASPSILNGKPYPGGKGSMKDNGTHVPLIASWPGKIPPEAVTHGLVDFSDVLPTIADVAGISDGHADWPLDGHSFWPTMQSRGGLHQRDSIYCWYDRNGIRENAKQLVRSQFYKLYANGRYFDTRNDLLEKKPLNVNNLQGGARKAYVRLKEKLAAHMAVTESADPVQNARRTETSRKAAKRSM